MDNNLLSRVWGAIKDKYGQVTSPDYWTPDAIGNRMVSGLQNAIQDPSGLIGGGLGGTVENMGKFLRPAIFDARASTCLTPACSACSMPHHLPAMTG